MIVVLVVMELDDEAQPTIMWRRSPKVEEFMKMKQ